MRVPRVQLSPFSALTDRVPIEAGKLCKLLLAEVRVESRRPKAFAYLSLYCSIVLDIGVHNDY